MKGLFSVRHVADHEVIPYLLHFTARRENRKKKSGTTSEIWIVGNPTQWFTKTQLNWSYAPNSYTMVALLGIGLVLAVAIGLNGYTLAMQGSGWNGFIGGAALGGLCLLGLVIAALKPKRPQITPRRLAESDSIRLVHPTIATTTAWYDLVRAVDRFLVILRDENHEYDQLSSKIYRELKRALWEAASVPDESVEGYSLQVLPTRGRDASALVDAYASSLQPLPANAA